MSSRILQLPQFFSSFLLTLRNYMNSLKMLVVVLLVGVTSFSFAENTLNPSIQGNTPEEIHVRFPGIIENNFATGKADDIIENLSDQEMSDLAAFYGNAKPYHDTSALLEILAKRLNAQHLVKVGRAFGNELTAQAVARYASQEVRDEFEATPKGNVLPINFYANLAIENSKSIPRTSP
jgi:hypothetical protein